MSISPQRATLWVDAYASALRGMPRADGQPVDETDLAFCRGTAQSWLDLRRQGYPITRSILTDAAADALGLPDGKPQTIRNFLRGL